MRIYIIGLAGSGKTTLSKKLGHQYRIVPVELDTALYQLRPGEKRVKLPRDVFMREIISLTKTDQWIVEGVFLFPELLQSADQIVWLKPSLPHLLYRQWRRYLTDPYQRSHYSMWGNFKMSWDICKASWGIGRDLSRGLRVCSMTEIADSLQPYAAKVSVVQ